jgi:flavin reductase (DIM6/NTAB) family NADH-FMN oxidoreductase RutF
MSSFKDLRIVDNFYQTSSFFPMPTVCISTVNEDGSLNVGSYSCVFLITLPARTATRCCWNAATIPIPD